MNISAWLTQATKQLKAVGITSARLDAELLLAETVRKPRTYLHAHPDETLDPRRRDIADARLSLRLDRVPLAYILGYKEFYGRRFRVTPAVLVPRPESEEMIELFLRLSGDRIGPQRLRDVGTGCGCLGITAALERPEVAVTLSDVSRPALQVASANATALQAHVTLERQSLLRGQSLPLDYIFANLPYVDRAWQTTSPELQHEPPQALYAAQQGLQLIYRLIAQAPTYLALNGYLFIEADPRQQDRIIAAGRTAGLQVVAAGHFMTVFGQQRGSGPTHKTLF